jgi:hypothetical protein
VLDAQIVLGREQQRLIDELHAHSAAAEQPFLPFP